ncbi:class I SAM-dependent methyltransferase [Desulfocurvibacter africanus]
MSPDAKRHNANNAGVRGNDSPGRRRPSSPSSQAPIISACRAPNRPLDLAELERPDYRDIVREMERMTAREDVSYLHPSKRWEYPWALEQAGLRPGDRVLDAGCGGSIFPAYLAAQGMSVAAVDLNPPAGLAAFHGLNYLSIQGNLACLPFAEGVFQAVFCISVIEHFPASGIALAMAELRRVLRPDGRLLLTTDYARDASEEMWHEGPGRSFRVDWNVFDRDSLSRHILNAEGFRIEGGVDLEVDWELVRPAMSRFHGYPYTSVGLTLVRV